MIFRFQEFYLTVYRQQADKKKRRKERDSLLKTQAESSKKKRNDELDLRARFSTQDTTSESVTMTGYEPPKQVTSSRGASLPALLPKELLEGEPAPRPLTPPMNISSVKPSTSNKLRLQAKSKAPKDMQRGSLRIRVLETDQSLLPPKASKSSKAIRESWLAGRRGSSFVRRKKQGGGFVRK